MSLYNIWLERGILLEVFKKRFFEFIQKYPNTWDYLIYIGIIIIVIWLIWVIFSSRVVRVKEKENISVLEVEKAKWNFSKKLPTIASSQRFIARLNFLKKRIEKEQEVIETSAALIEARSKKKFTEEIEKELDRRKK